MAASVSNHIYCSVASRSRLSYFSAAFLQRTNGASFEDSCSAAECDSTASTPSIASMKRSFSSSREANIILLHQRNFVPVLGNMFSTSSLSLSHLSARRSTNSSSCPGSKGKVIDTDKGEECYNLAITALQNAKRVKEKEEERLLREQYEAMDRQRQRTQLREMQRQKKKQEQASSSSDIIDTKDTRDRAAGVAVIHTIVKQSQPNAVKVNQYSTTNHLANISTSNDAANNCNERNEKTNDEEYWQRIAHKNLEEAAFRFGYPLALVRFGNEALELVKNPLLSSSSSIPLIDQARCHWIEESPVDLSLFLMLSAKADGVLLHHQHDYCSNTSSKKHDNQKQHHECLQHYLQLAVHLYKEAGKRGSSEGWFNLGHLYWEGVGIDNDTNKDGEGTSTQQYYSQPNKEKALKAFYHASELGDADAMYFLAVQYLSCDDEEEDEKDNNSRLLWNSYQRFGRNVETRNSFTSTDVSTSRPPSFITSNLQKHGYQLLRHAALGHQHGPALHHLALLHYQHNNNDVEFRLQLSQAAATGHSDSLFQQGHCFYFGTDGYGPSPNFEAALENFLAASERGHVDAMVSAGAMLHQGVRGNDGRSIIIRDQQRAFELYQQAGELGSVEGWRNVVACYLTGEGVPKCVDTARYIAKTMLKNDEVNVGVKCNDSD